MGETVRFEETGKVWTDSREAVSTRKDITRTRLKLKGKNSHSDQYIGFGDLWAGSVEEMVRHSTNGKAQRNLETRETWAGQGDSRLAGG